MIAIDLQSLRLFCAIVETRSVSHAADVLGTSQPAASYLLGRCREQIGDPLFLKSSKGMTATPKMLSLYQELRRGIDVLDSALSPAGFDPRRSDRNFRLAMSDIREMVFLPSILGRLQSLAPKVTVEVVQIPLQQLPRALDFGDVDFAVGNLPEICAETSYTTVFRERYVCFFRKQHQSIKRTLSTRQFEASDHIIVSSPFTGHHSVERSLLERDIRRRPTLKVANYTSVPNVIAETDLLVVIPSRVAKAFERTHGLRWLPLPVSIPSFDVRVHWSRRHETNEGHEWMRWMLLETLRRI
ncbi:LysR family transcriptional regulator [Bradyrhizobium genosp. P]|uniref:LysR family transcriptional regulator n=1 Tax=Bradyrhizobium genosp. P TaxID=83641 RepID=UPI003CF002B0